MNYFKYTLIVLFFLIVCEIKQKNGKIEQFSIEGWKILKIGMNFEKRKKF